ncbi:hypothetical protein GJ744_008748 [Endocarpon pusillum]|uniref:Uncharacterized protein n=1 Tax=Endocarpon pusillum TaxID=364733 RepID=A0A8H7ATW6_9EURO|nr:hypothetical protein GJ744_008748 [Endocarpon pusillum]
MAVYWQGSVCYRNFVSPVAFHLQYLLPLNAFFEMGKAILRDRLTGIIFGSADDGKRSRRYSKREIKKNITQLLRMSTN